MSEPMMPDVPVKAGEKHDGRFRPGVSGNPRGKPPGTRSLALQALDEIAEGAAPALLNRLIEAGLAGDVNAMRLVLDKLWPARKGRPSELALPPVSTPADCVTAMASVVDAVRAGEISVEEAAGAASLIGEQRKMIETADLAEQVRELQRQMKDMGR